jgi:DNA-binding response OmpR family regulator
LNRSTSPAGWVAIVADDEADERALVAMALSRAGFAIREAQDGEEVVALAISQPREGLVVVSDIGMPGMDGIAATAALRAQSTELPILLVTAFADEDTLGRAHEAGANRVLTKPLDLTELVATALVLVRGIRS